MKKYLGVLSTFLVTTIFAFVGEVEADTSVQFGLGYRSDQIDWKTGIPDFVDDTTLIDSESKLRLKDIEIVELYGRLKGSCGDCLYYRVDGSYGWIVDGTARTSDRFIFFEGDSCFGYDAPVFRHKVDKDYVADFNIGIGTPLHQCCCPNLQVIPAIGFAYDTQSIHIKNRHHDSSSSSESASIVGSGSSSERHRNRSRSTWWGPWIGVDLAFCNQECWNLYSEIEYHFARCRRHRTTDIGLRFLDNFHRTRQGSGWNVRLGSLYFFRCNMYVDGHFTYKRWTSNHHHDRLLWQSYAIGADIGYTF